MVVVYASMTGNVRRFVGKITRFSAYDIKEYDKALGDFVLITYTTGLGQIPVEVSRFLDNNHEHMVAVISSGNRNWGPNFGKSAETISQQYDVPVLYKFELSGTNKDAIETEERIEELGRKIYRTE